MQLLAGRYQMQAELGSGGMGTVYKGVDTQTEQTVAIKALRLEFAQPELIERFKREGQALRELDHPNIVKLLDALEHNGQHYLVMEYVPGGDLTGLLKQGPMPIEMILTLGIDLADALTRAHKLDIVHRDLKPANVLLGGDGVLRLTDFGVAHLGQHKRVTDADMLIGTLDYLPPEAFTGGVLDRRGDIWAFGIILFEMLTGQRPFSGESIAEVLYGVAVRQIPDLRTLRPDAPRALVDLVARMLEKDPQQRIASVRLVGAHLEAILNGEDPMLPPVQDRSATPEPVPAPFHLDLRTPLDPPPERLIGRDEKLAEIRRQLARGGRVLLYGLGGMGKTALAGALAEEHRTAHSPDSLRWLKVVGAPLDRLLDDVWRAAHGEALPPTEPVTVRAAMVRRLLEEVPDLLVVLDDITLHPGQTPNQTTAHVWRELVQPRGRPLLVTSRSELPGFTGVAVDELDPANAQTLMLEQLSGTVRTRLEDHPEALRGLCARVGHHALGLKVLAAVIEADFRTAPQEALTALPALQGVDASLELSWARLTGDAQLVLARLAALWDTTAGCGAELLRLCAPDLPAVAYRQALADLERRSMVRLVEGRYTLHELVRDYARRQRDETRAAVAGCVAYAGTYSGKKVEHWDKLATELDNLLGAAAFADEHGLHAAVNRLAFSLYGKGRFMQMREHQRQAVELLQAGIRAARALTSRQDEGTLLKSLGTAYWSLGRMQDATDAFERSLAISQEMDDRHGESDMLNNLGVVYTNLGQMQRALAYYERTLTIKRELSDRRGEGAVLNNLGNTCRHLGQLERAITYFQQALSIRREMDDRRGEGHTLGNLGNAYLDLGQIERALEAYLTNLAISREINDRRSESRVLNNLANAYRRLGQLERALDMGQQSLVICQEIGDRHSEGTALDSLALIYRAQGDFQRAAALLERALAVGRETADRSLEADVLFDMGLLREAQGHLEQAVACVRHARAIFVELGIARMVAQCDTALQRLRATR